MKRLILLALAICSTAIAQTTTDNVYTFTRYLAKPGQEEALKAAFFAHAAKYHSGTNKWSLSVIDSGPDTGMFQVKEGPSNFNTLEDRGDLSIEHHNDYVTNINPFVQTMSGAVYEIRDEELSTAYDSKVIIKKFLVQRYVLKPGHMAALYEKIKIINPYINKTLKGGHSFFRTFYSGVPTIILTIWLNNGYKDVAGTQNKVSEAYDADHGVGAGNKFFASYSEDMERIDSEIIESIPNPAIK